MARKSSRPVRSPAFVRLRRRMFFLLGLDVVLTLATCLYILLVGSSYTFVYPLPEGVLSAAFAPENPGVVEIVSQKVTDGEVHVTLRAVSRGDVVLTAASDTLQTQALEPVEISVGPMRVIRDVTFGRNFSGYPAIMLAFSVFFLAAGAAMALSVRDLMRGGHFSYRTVIICGIAIFCPCTAVMFAVYFFLFMFGPGSQGLSTVYSAILLAGESFLAISFPLTLVLAVSLSVSNVSLIRREGFRPVNLLGFALGVTTLAGTALSLLYAPRDGASSMHSVGDALRIDFTLVVSYFQCMLMATIICAYSAAKHQPRYDKTHIIILGCRIRKDGTLPPLLRGRVDKALEFARRQEALTGTAPCFVPSGGKGDDEICPEAEAMARYLIEQGVAPGQILPETRSATTLENLRFSHEIIRKTAEQSSVAFSTTNYHVFRSCILSRKAGLETEGMGSSTKWYFWPNAFVREFVGLLHAEWRSHLNVVLLILLVCLHIALPLRLH